MRLGLRWLLCWRLRWFFCACLIVIASPGMAHAQASKTGATGDPFAHKNVLVLTSYAEGYGAQDRIVAGLLAGVIEAGGKTEDLHIEKLDLLRHTSPEYSQQLLTFLQNKYRDQKPDLIVPRFKNIERVARRKLLQLQAATELASLRVPPGNHLEALKGNRKGQHSIRINDQWRICFVWHNDGAYQVEIVDYH